MAIAHPRFHPRNVFAAVALIAALAAAPTTYAAAPVVRDTGSSWSTVRVAGSGFTPSNLVSTRQAYVQIENVDPSGAIVDLGENVTVSGMTCGAQRFTCTTGGTFAYEHYMQGYQCGRRYVRAYDYATSVWSQWIQVDCA